MPNIHHHKILILDFGSQYTQLIARRIREIGVYCELFPYDVSSHFIENFNPSGIILSGGPDTVSDDNSARVPDEIFNLNSEINNKFDVAYVLNKFQNLQKFKYSTDGSREKGLKEVSTLIIDSTKANKILNWNAKYELDEIIEMIFNWELHYSKNNDNSYSLNEIEKYINK